MLVNTALYNGYRLIYLDDKTGKKAKVRMKRGVRESKGWGCILIVVVSGDR